MNRSIPSAKPSLPLGRSGRATTQLLQRVVTDFHQRDPHSLDILFSDMMRRLFPNFDPPSEEAAVLPISDEARRILTTYNHSVLHQLMFAVSEQFVHEYQQTPNSRHKEWHPECDSNLTYKAAQMNLSTTLDIKLTLLQFLMRDLCRNTSKISRKATSSYY